MTCKVCGLLIKSGEGMHYRGKHIHKKCKPRMQIFWWRY